MVSASERPASRATMRDVAALAGVGAKTVSRVINNEAGVSEAKRERVLSAVDRLDYRHNWAASHLRRGGDRTGVIAALVQDVGNHFSATLLRAIEDAADERGMALLAASLDEQVDRERDRVRALVSRRVDGLVLMPATATQDYLVGERRAGMPIVFVDRRPHGVDFDSVAVDNEAGAYAGVQHLLQQGHRRIGLLADLVRIETARMRIAGYKRALTDAGITPDPTLMHTDLHDISASSTAMAHLLDSPDPPTAVFATRNVTAIGALHVINNRGLQRTLALVGFDDFPIADLTDPPLTVIKQDITALGHAAAQRLWARLDGDTAPPQHLTIPHQLIPRGSGEIPPDPART
ncbi:MAG: LacI family DNA-binding transcriptional regulator [Ornithinimicrobium sp.]